jgi:hypothetical protein
MDRSSSHPPRWKVAPLQKSIKARTAEDALRAVGQLHAQLGGADIHTDNFGGIDFMIKHQIKSYHKVDDPPRRVKTIHITITIIVYIMAQAYGVECNKDDLAIEDKISIAFLFLFLLRTVEYTGTTSDDTSFQSEDVVLYIWDR